MRSLVEMIRDNFVPVAVDNYMPGAPDEQFYPGTSNGYIAFTATGEMLGEISNLDDLKSTIAQYKGLPEAKRKPGKVQKSEAGPSDKIPPQAPPGTLSLIVYYTPLERDEKGDFARARKIIAPGPSWVIDPTPTHNDLVWITQEEWKALVPASPKKGDKVAVPSSLERRIAVFYAFDFGLVHSGAWFEDEVRSVDMTVTVEQVTSDAVTLRLEGHSKIGVPFEKYRDCKTCAGECEHAGTDLDYLGTLIYNLKKKAFDQFDVVALGEGWAHFVNWHRSLGEEASDPSKRHRWPLGLAFRIASDGPADRNGWPQKAGSNFRSGGADYWQKGK